MIPPGSILIAKRLGAGLVSFIVSWWREILIGVLLGFCAHYREDAEDARRDLKLERAQQVAEYATREALVASDAIRMLNEAAARVSLAAQQHGEVRTELGASLDRINRNLKELRDAKPLPPDCRPDPERVHRLDEAVDAANRAAAGQPPLRAVPPAQ